jgi:hypothetical protein
LTTRRKERPPQTSHFRSGYKTDALHITTASDNKIYLLIAVKINTLDVHDPGYMAGTYVKIGAESLKVVYAAIVFIHALNCVSQRSVCVCKQAEDL